MTEVKNSNFLGNLDYFKDGIVGGWAVNRLKLDTSASVDVYINDVFVLTSVCGLKRKDVFEAGVGRVDVGFEINITDVLQFFSEVTISVRYSGTAIELPGSPIKKKGGIEGASAVSTLDQLALLHPNSEKLFDGIGDGVKKTTQRAVLSDLQKHVENGGKIVVFPPLVDWNIPLFQRPQHMAKWLARCGAKVIYISGAWKYDFADGFYQLEENLYWTNQLNFLDVMPSAWISVYSTNFNYSISNVINWRDKGHKILYEYIDHIDPKISGGSAVALAELYDSVNEQNVDLFLASAVALKVELQQRFSDHRITFVPNGVDTEFYFDSSRKDVDALQENFKVVAERSLSGRKIVGYFGAIAPWLDYDLITQLALRNPELDFVFVGPAYNLEHELPNADNIFWIGQINYPILPDHAMWFDVCFIPFEVGQIAKTTSPLKLYEYFALGKPVVVTACMDECTQYDFVLRGGNVDELTDALSQALKKSTDKRFVKFLKEEAVRHSWESRSKDLLIAMDSLSQRGNARASEIQIANNVKFLAFNAQRSERILGATVNYDLKKNAITASISNEAFCAGDLLSIILSPIDIDSRSLIRTNLTIKANKIQTKGIVVVDYLLSNLLIKTIDFVDLHIADTISIVHGDDISLEIRCRVLQDIPSSWLPSESIKLRLSTFTQASIERDDNKQFRSSNPLGFRNPLL